MTNEKMTFDELFTPPYGTDLIGPFSPPPYHKVSVDGYLVPHLYIYKRGDTDTDWTVVLDSRFEYDVNDGELRRFMPLIANAMAIAAGYSCFGENSQLSNRYQTQIGMLPIDIEEAE